MGNLHRLVSINVGPPHLTLMWSPPGIEPTTKKNRLLTRQKPCWLRYSYGHRQASNLKHSIYRLYTRQKLCWLHHWLTLKRRLHLQQMLNATCNATCYFSNMCCRIVHSRFKKCNCNTQQNTILHILGMFSYLIKFVSRSTFYTNKTFFCGHYGSLHEKKKQLLKEKYFFLYQIRQPLLHSGSF